MKVSSHHRVKFLQCRKSNRLVVAIGEVCKLIEASEYSWVISRNKSGRLWYVYEPISGTVISSIGGRNKKEALKEARQILYSHTIREIRDAIANARQHNIPYEEYKKLPVGTLIRKEK